jgi:hypothetical protein
MDLLLCGYTIYCNVSSIRLLHQRYGINTTKTTQEIIYKSSVFSKKSKSFNHRIHHLSNAHSSRITVFTTTTDVFEDDLLMSKLQKSKKQANNSMTSFTNGLWLSVLKSLKFCDNLITEQ